MSKTLLLDNNFSSEPFLRTSYYRDFEQHYCGSQRSYQIGGSEEVYWNIDYSDKAKIIQLIQDQNFHGLIPGCNDLSYLMGSKMSETFSGFSGFDTFENTVLINDKKKFRENLLSLGLPSPARLSLNDFHKYKKLIVKPVDSYSGKGISILSNPNKKELKNAIVHAKVLSPTDAYIIEEFVDGQLYSHSAFLRNGKIKADFIVEEHCIVNEFRVDTSWLCALEDFNFLKELRTAIEELSRELNLVDGLIHTQFISNGKTFWIIETMRRCPGDLFSQLIEMSKNFSYCDAYVQPFLGQKYLNDIVFSSDNRKSDGYIVRHTAHIKNGDTFRGISFDFGVKVNRVVPLKSSHSPASEDQDTRVAIIFLSVADYGQLENLINLIKNHNLYSLI